jgi:hypothetical protein
LQSARIIPSLYGPEERSLLLNGSFASRNHTGRRLCEKLLDMSSAADFRILAKRLSRRRQFGAKLSPMATSLAIVALNGYADLLEAGQFLAAGNAAGMHEKTAHDGPATNDQTI